MPIKVEKSPSSCVFVRPLDGELGFVKDVRRLTVAASRAQSLWIGVGDSGPWPMTHPQLLRSSNRWARQTVWEWLFDEED